MTATMQADEGWASEFQRLEEVVRQSDDNGVRARWQSGRHLLSLRQGNRFRRGEIADLAQRLGVHRSELTARVKFATKFASEQELTMVISQFKSWWAIKQQALTDTPREVVADESASAEEQQPPIHPDPDQQPGSRTLHRVLTLLENVDPTTFDEDDDKVLTTIAACVERLRDAIDTLQAVA